MDPLLSCEVLKRTSIGVHFKGYSHPYVVGCVVSTHLPSTESMLTSFAPTAMFTLSRPVEAGRGSPFGGHCLSWTHGVGCGESPTRLLWVCDCCGSGCARACVYACERVSERVSVNVMCGVCGRCGVVLVLVCWCRVPGALVLTCFPLFINMHGPQIRSEH